VLPVRAFNYGLINVEQLWAQMKQEYLKIKDKVDTAELRRVNNEYGWFMSPEERAQMNPLQERFRTVDPIDRKSVV
jgi:hypothetical protein